MMYGPHWGMMGEYGWGGYWPFHMIFWIVIAIAVIACMVWMMRSMAGGHGRYALPRRSAGLDVLEERYARGEIGRDEYLQKKKDIAG
jgi:putative membrane protein